MNSSRRKPQNPEVRRILGLPPESAELLASSKPSCTACNDHRRVIVEEGSGEKTEGDCEECTPPLNGRPWEIVDDVAVLPQYSDGEPAQDGSILVRLQNTNHPAFDGCPPISLAIVHPNFDDNGAPGTGRSRTTLAGSMITPVNARRLASALIRAADFEDNKVTP